MKVAIMQPYFMPYIGYFQMIKAVDVFVFYDDVNYIKGGWINRNRILVNNHEYIFTIPLNGLSQNKEINEITILKESKNYNKLIKSIEQAYKKAPYFREIFPLIDNILNNDDNITLISQLSIKSVKEISSYLNIDVQFKISSEEFSHSKFLDRSNRLMKIVKECNGNHYINAVGGIELYSKDEFKKKDIKLSFIKPNDIVYRQFSEEFIPWLSMVDVLMFNSPEEINRMLDEYKFL